MVYFSIFLHLKCPNSCYRVIFVLVHVNWPKISISARDYKAILYQSKTLRVRRKAALRTSHRLLRCQGRFLKDVAISTVILVLSLLLLSQFEFCHNLSFVTF